MSTEVADEKLTVKELAREMRVHPTTIYRAIRAGVLDALRVGVGQGTLRITHEARDAYRRACRENASTHTRVAPGDDPRTRARYGTNDDEPECGRCGDTGGLRGDHTCCTCHCTTPDPTDNNPELESPMSKKTDAEVAALAAALDRSDDAAAREHFRNVAREEPALVAEFTDHLKSSQA